MAQQIIVQESQSFAKLGEIAVISVTATSAATDISAAAQLGSAVKDGRAIVMVSDAEVYYFFAPDGTSTVSNTATSGSTRGAFLAADEPTRAIIPSDETNGAHTFLTIRTATGNATVRLWFASNPR